MHRIKRFDNFLEQANQIHYTKSVCRIKFYKLIYTYPPILFDSNYPSHLQLLSNLKGYWEEITGIHKLYKKDEAKEEGMYNISYLC